MLFVPPITDFAVAYYIIRTIIRVAYAYECSQTMPLQSNAPLFSWCTMQRRWNGWLPLILLDHYYHLTRASAEAPRNLDEPLIRVILQANLPRRSLLRGRRRQ